MGALFYYALKKRDIGHFVGYRTFRVGFNADGASVYRASLAFIFFEKIYKGGQNVLVKSLKTLANTGKIGFYFFIRT